VAAAPSLVITPPSTPATSGLPASFNFVVTPATTNPSAIRDLTVNWGDGSTQDLGAVTGTAARETAKRELDAARAAAKAETEAGRVAEVARVGREVKQILPQIDAETDAALFGLARKDTTAKLGQVMKPTLDTIKERLGPVVRFDVPALGTTRVTLEEAIDGMWQAGKDTRPQIRAEIIAKLNQLDPQGAAGQLFDEALQQRAAARTYLGIVDKALDKNNRYDPRKAAEYVNKNYAKLQRFAGKSWPQIESALLGGRKAGEALPDVPGLPTAVLPRASRYLGHEVPLGWSRRARAVQDATREPGTQAALDAFLGTPPYSAVAVNAMEWLAKPALRHVPGGREVSEAIEEAAAE